MLPNKLSEFSARIIKSSIVPVFSVIVAIQGTVIAGQFLAALFLTPNEIGVIRSIESALTVLVVIAGCGGQTLLVKDAAIAKTPSDQESVLIQGIATVLLGSGLVGTLLVVISFTVKYKIIELVASCVILIALTNIVRLLIAYMHGTKRVGSIYIPTCIASVLSICIILGGSRLYGVDGWIIGRHFAELIMLSVIWIIVVRLKLLRAQTFKVSWASIIKFTKRGAKSNISLIVRMAADAMPILLANALRVPTDMIAQIGLAILGTQLVMLPLAVMAQHALPRIVLDQSKVDRTKTKFFYIKMLIAASVGALIFGTLAVLARLFVGGNYNIAYACGFILSFALPFKALCLYYGTLFLIHENFIITAKANLFEMMIFIAVGAILNIYFGVIGIAIAVLISATSTFLILNRSYRSSGYV